MDGTFDHCPILYIPIEHTYLPIVYCIFLKQSQTNLNKLFTILTSKIFRLGLTWIPATIIIDFKQAIQTSKNEVFRECQIMNADFILPSHGKNNFFLKYHDLLFNRKLQGPLVDFPNANPFRLDMECCHVTNLYIFFATLWCKMCQWLSALQIKQVSFVPWHFYIFLADYIFYRNVLLRSSIESIYQI